jgi:hypothetical protein
MKAVIASAIVVFKSIVGGIKPGMTLRRLRMRI